MRKPLTFSFLTELKVGKGVPVMAKSDYLAKTTGGVQTIEEHTQEVLASLEQLFACYGDHFTEREQFLLRLACETHDLGKMNEKFQTKLKKNQRLISGEVPHGILSALFLNKKLLEKEGVTKTEFRALVNAVMHHHARHFDLKQVCLSDYVKDYLQASANDYFQTSSYRFRLNNVNLSLFGSKINGSYDAEAWLKFVLLKGILNKADYAASNLKEVAVERPVLTGDQSLKHAILSQIGQSLHPAQAFLMEHTDENVLMVAPAGSGKTEGSLLWAGEHKTFFTLPLKVSSDGIYRRVRDRYAFEEVALLHSDALTHQLEHDGMDMDTLLSRYEEMTTLAYPVTICTVDQLFKFVFKSLGTEVVASTLRYSKVIIDEIQSYHPKIMAYLCYGLKLLHQLGGKFLLMTATLPPMISSYLNQQGIPLVEKTFSDLSAGTRHCLTIKGEASKSLTFDFDLILTQAQTKKVLVLCNTVRQAQAIYRHLSEQAGTSTSVQLLHSRFIKKHRKELESAIIAFARNGRTDGQGIWISTQIVEASLDIDFDVIHTEMCPVDSLFQRMGRCYRSRTYTKHEPNIFIYPTLNGRGTVYDEVVYDRSLEVLKQYQGQLLTEGDKMKMVEVVYDEQAIQQSEYYQTFKKALKDLEDIAPGTFSKRDSNYLFREIKNVTLLPDSIYTANKETLIEPLLAILEDKSASLKERLLAKQDLMELTVSVSTFGKLPDGVDPELLGAGRLDVHRAKLHYSYDETTQSGLGLVLEQVEEADPFIES